MGAIGGVFNFNEIEKRLNKMTKALAHRMDNKALYFEANWGFINHETITKNNQLILTFNGAIYNLKDLKKQFNLQAESLNNIILELYDKHGTTFFKFLEGSFTFAIFDKEKNKLFIVRDQIGEKVVYFWYKNHKLLFSSEIKGILTNPEVKREVNLASLEKYFTFSYVSGEDTMIKDVYELLPSCYIEFDHDNFSLNRYWNFYETPTYSEAELSEKALTEELKSLLNDSINKRIPEKETLGVFLSGGIDSSLVAAIAQKNSEKKINTYSIHFGKDYPNELYYSSMVAEHIKSNHKIVEIRPKSFLNEMFHIIKCLDDPIGDPITVPNFLLAQEAKKEANVIFNGEGGDPCFGGPKNIPMMLSQIYSEQAEKYFVEKYYLKSYRKCYEILPYMLSENTLKTLESEYESIEEYVSKNLAEGKLNTFLDKLMYLNVKMKGVHHILVKVDKMTSANGISAIAPIFTPDITNFSFKIPANLKLNGRVEKYLLKKAVEDVLPHEVVYREKKGMMVPVKFWFQKDLKKYAKKILAPKNIKEKGYFNPEFIKKLLNSSLDSRFRQNEGLKLWMLITFEIWHQIFIENNDDFS